MKKELAQKRLTREIEMARMTLNELRKQLPLKEGLVAIKEKLIDEVIEVVARFVEALQKVSKEEEKVKGFLTYRVEFLGRSKEQRPVITRSQPATMDSQENANFCREYWFHMGWLRQSRSQYQDLSKELLKVKDKVHARMEAMSYVVKFLEEDSVIREASEVATKVKHLIRGLLLTEDMNAYRTESHAKHMMVYTWQLEMERTNRKVDDFLERNREARSEIVYGLELVVGSRMPSSA